MQDQSDVLRFLMTAPGSNRLGEAATETDVFVHETHISFVVLVNQHAYKLKRAVRLPYLDFSSPALRLDACRRELELNRRTAPAIYLAVRRITRRAKGGLEFDGPGDMVDAVVHMRRFADNNVLDSMAERQQLTVPLMTRLAHSIARFHASAAVSTDTAGAARVAAVLNLNEQSQTATARILKSDRPVELNQILRETLARHGSLLDTRARTGKVRLCHGDLHLRNICMWDGEAVPFDCLEFNESMATIDVFYDLAFLLMDLWRYGERRLANVVMNRYLDENDSTDGLPLLPFFMALRAAIRAQVLATQADIAGQDRAALYIGQANQFLDLAFDIVQPRPIRLIAIGGLSGTGKSTLAAALSDSVGPVPGARILSSDRIRKRVAGVTAETTLPAQTYTQEASDRVYQIQAQQARHVLAHGHAVIADAVFSQASERRAIELCAMPTGVPFTGVWLEARPAKLIDRVQARKNDPSDATADVVRKQLERDLGDINWNTIPADNAPSVLLNKLKKLTVRS